MEAEDIEEIGEVDRLKARVRRDLREFFRESHGNFPKITILDRMDRRSPRFHQVTALVR